MYKSKQLLSFFLDFLILILLISFLCFGFYLIKHIVFYDDAAGSDIYLITKEVDADFSNGISKNMPIYDTLTKRYIGYAETVYVIESGDKIRFLVFIKADFTPKSQSLRTRNLWFEYSIISKNEFESVYAREG